jgi:DNA (cytosine-5)-methyltransferase 1
MTTERPADTLKAAEFFAGIGLAGLGLSRAGIGVVWSNDIAASKHAMFVKNFSDLTEHEYVVEDLRKVEARSLPTDIDLAWASFPCTDLSIAGGRAGLHRGSASSTFWLFIKLLSALGEDRPSVVALENVTAFATSQSGRDISSAIRSLNGLGYSVDVLNIDARRFVPQSRPRLFLIGTRLPVGEAGGDSPLRPTWLSTIYEDSSLKTHKFDIPEPPPLLDTGLESFVEDIGEADSRWWSDDRVTALIASLSELQLARFEALRVGNTRTVRSAYRRMRHGTPRWELRAGAIAGCLRTSSGGSSKQALVFLGEGKVAARWMTPREYAALMGVPDYQLDGVLEHHAYSGFGDAVCAPVVEWLAHNYIVPHLKANARASAFTNWRDVTLAS